MGLDAIKILGGATIALAVYLGLIDNPWKNKATINVTIQIIIQDTTQMPFDIDSILSGLFGTVLNTGGQVAAQEMDYRNQTRLMEKQNQYYQENARLQQGLALDTWEKTGYGAQRAQMERAGLNPGLMYGKGGGGGGTVQSPGGAQPTISAPPRLDPGMALQIGLNTAKTQAEIDNIKADTDKKRKEIPQIEANTQYLIAKTGLTQVDTHVAQLEADLKRATLPADIEQAYTTLDRLITEADTAKVQNRVQKSVADSTIESAKIAVTQAHLNLTMTKAQLFKVDAERKQIDEFTKEASTRIWKMIEEIGIKWKDYDLEKRQTAVAEALKDLRQREVLFNTSDAARWGQYIGNATRVAETVGTMNTKGAK